MTSVGSTVASPRRSGLTRHLPLEARAHDGDAAPAPAVPHRAFRMRIHHGKLEALVGGHDRLVLAGAMRDPDAKASRVRNLVEKVGGNPRRNTEGRGLARGERRA